MILKFQLASFDLNHDNVFSGPEQTLQQKIAMDAVINDVGRNLTFAFAAPWSLFGINFFIYSTWIFGCKKIQKPKLMVEFSNNIFAF